MRARLDAGGRRRRSRRRFSNPPARRVAAPLGLAALAALILASTGCGPRSPVLASVGEATITIADFMETARGAEGRYPADPDSAKAMLLGDLVQRQLLLAAARQRGFDRDSAALLHVRSLEADALSDALLGRLLPRDVPVSEAEIRRLHEWRETEARMQVIYVMDRRMADAAMAELRRGADFGDVADRFNPANTLPPRGEVEFMPPGSLVGPVDEPLRDAPPGELVGPLHAPGEGWFIVKILERRPRPQPPLDEERPALADMLRQRKRRAISVRVFQDLRVDYRVRLEPEGPYILFRRYNRAAAEAEPPATPADLAQPLARYDGGPGFRGVYKLDDALGDLDRARGALPNATSLSSLGQWIEAQVVRRVVVLEARRRHIHEERDVARRLRETLNEYLLDMMYQREVVAAAAPDEGDVRAAYAMRSDFLVDLRSVRVQHLTIPDSAGAAGVAERVRRYPTLRDAILHASAGLEVREDVVPFPNEDPVWTSLRIALIGMEPGAYGGPRPARDGWMVFQLVAKDQSLPAFEDLDPDVQHRLRAEAVAIAQERRLGALNDSLRRAIPVTENRALLGTLPWPVPAGARRAG